MRMDRSIWGLFSRGGEQVSTNYKYLGETRPGHELGACQQQNGFVAAEAVKQLQQKQHRRVRMDAINAPNRARQASGVSFSL